MGLSSLLVLFKYCIEVIPVYFLLLNEIDLNILLRNKL